MASTHDSESPLMWRSVLSVPVSTVRVMHDTVLQSPTLRTAKSDLGGVGRRIMAALNAPDSPDLGDSRFVRMTAGYHRRREDRGGQQLRTGL
ncbi:hypothetical protein MLPF_0055 [Mycobacterium lepromatosis]|nr:hypothetical protein MLPF_0055 [Mycobacterium lepromatosis]